MEYYNIRESQTSINNSVNSHFLYKYRLVPKQRNTSSNIIPSNMNAHMNGYNNNSNLIKFHQNTQIASRKHFSPITSNYMKSDKTKSYGNINNQDINIIKMKMGFDLLTHKLNMINEQVQMANESIKANNIIDNNEQERIYFRDKIRSKNIINKNNLINNNYSENLNNQKFHNISSQSQNNYMPYPNNFRNYYSNQNLNDINKYQNKSYNLVKNEYSTNLQNNCLSYNSLEGEKIDRTKALNYEKYNSHYDLKMLNMNINKGNIDNNYYKYSNSNNNIPIPIPFPQSYKIKPKNYYKYFQLIKKKDKEDISSISFKNRKKSKAYIINQKLNNYINRDKENIDSKNNNNIKINNNINNDSFGKEYGSFDNYFLDNQTDKKKDSMKSNNKENKINVIYKNDKHNFNIYNIINKDKIIQNNYYNVNNNKENKQDLKVENQKTLNFIGKNEKDKLNINNTYEESETLEEEESKRTKFQQNQLKKCSETDIFLPKYDHVKSKSNNNTPTKLEENKKLIKVNLNKKSKRKIICKDDFYYDLYVEKIINVTKNNYSIDEEYKLFDIRKRINDKFENKMNKNELSNEKEKKIKIKKVRFYEGDNRFIEINQEEKVSKFNVYNYLGNKIYFKHCNFSEYLQILKNKNYRIKSILTNKIIDNSDNSEWNKLYDLINNLKNKNNSKEKKKNGFNIKNIESFKKNGIKFPIKNITNKSEISNRQDDNIKSNIKVNKRQLTTNKENNKLKNNINNKKNINLYNSVKNKSNKYNYNLLSKINSKQKVLKKDKIK